MKDKVIIGEYDCGCIKCNPTNPDGSSVWRLCRNHGDLIFNLVTDSPLRRKFDMVKEMIKNKKETKK